MSLSSGDLTTLATVKAYMDSPPADVVLSGLVTRISRWILGRLNRPLLVPATYTEQFNGTGTRALVLPNWPVLSISSLKIAGSTVSISPQDGDLSTVTEPWGYRFQPWNGLPPGNAAVLELVGGVVYENGNQNILATYTAGYQVTGELWTIPATPFQITPRTPYGIWATDRGVTFVATGVALTAITSGTPTTGQYLPPDPNASTPRLTYLFAAADVAKAISISYGFIPGDVEQAAIELITERSTYRKRVGLRSQSLAGQESMSFDNSGIPPYIMAMLADYVSVIPPATGANV